MENIACFLFIDMFYVAEHTSDGAYHVAEHTSDGDLSRRGAYVGWGTKCIQKLLKTNAKQFAGPHKACEIKNIRHRNRKSRYLLTFIASTYAIEFFPTVFACIFQWYFPSPFLFSLSLLSCLPGVPIFLSVFASRACLAFLGFIPCLLLLPISL